MHINKAFYEMFEPWLGDGILLTGGFEYSSLNSISWSKDDFHARFEMEINATFIDAIFSFQNIGHFFRRV